MTLPISLRPCSSSRTVAAMFAGAWGGSGGAVLNGLGGVVLGSKRPSISCKICNCGCARLCLLRYRVAVACKCLDQSQCLARIQAAKSVGVLASLQIAPQRQRRNGEALVERCG